MKRTFVLLFGIAFTPLLLSMSFPRGGDWPMWGGRPDRNMVSSEKGLPTAWGKDWKKHVKWTSDLGTDTFGNPVIAGGRIFIGTNNGKPRDPAVEGDKGIVMCFSEADGKFLWQAVHDKLSTGNAEDFSEIGICSTPCVVGERVYYVSNRAELVCCDVKGFSDGENDGPFKGEKRSGPKDADVVWSLDMRKDLGITLFQAAASSPLVVDDLVFVVTGQGIHSDSGKVKDPGAPSFIAVNRGTGKVVWQDSSPGDRIHDGQWGSPAYAVVEGQAQVAFPGGDGWLYAFEPKSGKLLWKFDCNGHEKGESKNQLIATPVYVGHRVLISSGANPEDGDDAGCLRAIDARKRGDITKAGELWRLAGEGFGRSISNVAVQDGLVYAIELGGFLDCVELESGKRVWRHDLLSVVWGSPVVADGHVYVRNSDGELVVFRTGLEKKIVATNTLGRDAVNGTVVAANGVLYVAGKTRLYALRAEN